MMNHTRKNRSAQHMGSSTQLPPHSSTFHGLNKWHNAKFEKLGWMVLAKAKGHDFKIIAYKKGIYHLIKSIEHVMDEYSDHDRKHDLHVLLMNAKVLEAYVNKHL